jgi:hypothetical protein
MTPDRDVWVCGLVMTAGVWALALAAWWLT